jgi:hypothetical protein
MKKIIIATLAISAASLAYAGPGCGGCTGGEAKKETSTETQKPAGEQPVEGATKA